MQRIIAIAADQFYVIGVTLVGGRLRHRQEQLQERAREDDRLWQYPTPAPTNPPQYFFES